MIVKKKHANAVMKVDPSDQIPRLRLFAKNGSLKVMKLGRVMVMMVAAIGGGKRLTVQNI